MPRVGLEPTRIAPADFKSAASADSATPAEANINRYVDIMVRVGVNSFGLRSFNSASIEICL